MVTWSKVTCDHNLTDIIPPGMCFPPGTHVQGKGVACMNVQLYLCNNIISLVVYRNDSHGYT